MQLTHIDGRHSQLNAGGKGISLSVGLPQMLSLEGLSALPENIGKATARIESAPPRLQRGAPGNFVLAGDIPPEQVQVIAPAGWEVKNADNLRWTITSPETTPAREGEIIFRLQDTDGHVIGILNTRPTMTGQLGLEVTGMPAPAGGKPMVKLTIFNQGAQEQTVTWTVSIDLEQALVNGTYSAPIKSSAYLTESGNGNLTIPAKSESTVTIPVDGVQANKLYQLKASITDSTGGVLDIKGDLRP